MRRKNNTTMPTQQKDFLWKVILLFYQEARRLFLTPEEYDEFCVYVQSGAVHTLLFMKNN